MRSGRSRAALASETVTDWVGEIARLDAARGTIEVRVASVRDAAGHTVAAVVVVAGVTARVLAARERERLLHELETEHARRGARAHAHAPGGAGPGDRGARYGEVQPDPAHSGRAR